MIPPPFKPSFQNTLQLGNTLTSEMCIFLKNGILINLTLILKFVISNYILKVQLHYCSLDRFSLSNNNF